MEGQLHLGGRQTIRKPAEAVPMFCEYRTSADRAATEPLHHTEIPQPRHYSPRVYLAVTQIRIPGNAREREDGRKKTAAAERGERAGRRSIKQGKPARRIPTDRSLPSSLFTLDPFMRDGGTNGQNEGAREGSWGGRGGGGGGGGGGGQGGTEKVVWWKRK